MKRFLTIAIIVLAIAAGTFYLLRPQPVAVAVTRVARGDVYSTVSNTRAGTVDACRRAGLSPALGGQIAALPVQRASGRNGALLLQLWNDDMAASLRRAERDARAARSQARARPASGRCPARRRPAHGASRSGAHFEKRRAAVGKADADAAGCAAAAIQRVSRRASTSRARSSSAPSCARRSPASSPKSTASSASS